MTAHRFLIPDGQPRERLDKVLAQLLTGTSRATLQRWIEEGRVTVDGKSCRSRDRVGPTQLIEVVPAPPPATNATPDPSVCFEVLYEDSHLIVVDKPAGVVVHPAKGHAAGTLVNGLVARYDWAAVEPESGDSTAALRPGIVHRIDKDTSGILVVARTVVAREGLKEQLAAHEMGRRYLAISVGVPRSTTFRTFYGRHPRSRLKWSSTLQDGKIAVTHVQTVDVFGSGVAALIECRLETGRTHQIRVHLAEQARTPLLADELYGRRVLVPEIVEAERLIARQALHAAELTFRHPVTAEELSFRSEPPADFARALAYLRGVSARA